MSVCNISSSIFSIKCHQLTNWTKKMVHTQLWNFKKKISFKKLKRIYDGRGKNINNINSSFDSSKVHCLKESWWTTDSGWKSRAKKKEIEEEEAWPSRSSLSALKIEQYLVQVISNFLFDIKIDFTKPYKGALPSRECFIDKRQNLSLCLNNLDHISLMTT